MLILIRSKLLNRPDHSIGIEYIYQIAQNWAIQEVNSRWSTERKGLQEINTPIALLDPQFPGKISDLIKTHIRSRPSAVQMQMKSALEDVIDKKPASRFEASDEDWGLYFYTLIGVALDACGPTVVRTMPGFA